MEGFLFINKVPNMFFIVLIKRKYNMSLKVIKINEIGDYLTVDTTNISVDNDIITVDTTLAAHQNYILRLPYRFFTYDVNLILWDEVKELETIIPLTVTKENGAMVLSFWFDFQDGQSFEVKVLSRGDGDADGKLIWRGKIYSTTQDDLENFKLHTTTQNNIIKI